MDTDLTTMCRICTFVKRYIPNDKDEKVRVNESTYEAALTLLPLISQRTVQKIINKAIFLKSLKVFTEILSLAPTNFHSSYNYCPKTLIPQQ